MEKILIGLYVPAAQERFDIFAPADLDVAALARILAEGVADLCSGRYNTSGAEMLIQSDPPLLLDPDRTLADYGIRDGMQLILL